MLLSSVRRLWSSCIIFRMAADTLAMGVEAEWKMIAESCITRATAFIPTLSRSNHKGTCGKVGVVGGSTEYTGAPYFAGISAMRCGADLCHIFCMNAAAPVIKSYSPELIVHPILELYHSLLKEKIEEVFVRLNAVVLGPGMGRYMGTAADTALRAAIARNMPIVIDADGLHYLSDLHPVVNGYEKAILTPNIAEFRRLQHLMNLERNDNPLEEVKALSKVLGNVTVVLKGKKDIIAQGSNVAICDVEGSNRRCGGQGDILSGTLAVFAHWSHGDFVSAAFAACAITRRCNHFAFKEKGRSMVCTDMIPFIHKSFTEFFPEKA